MIYLNNAATSFPKPAAVHRAVAACLASPPHDALRSGYECAREDLIAGCREDMAALFHISSPQRLVFTSGATESLCLALFGLELNDQAHVVTTAIEHNSVLRPLKTLEKAGRISLTIVACDRNGHIDPSDLCQQLTPATKVVVVNHCSNVTGAVTDLTAIGLCCAERGITFLVDAAQSAGLLPLDVEAMHIDLLAFTGHKALYGMAGVGGLFIRPGLHLKPLKVGGTGVRSDYLLQPETMPLYYEAGTPNLPGIASLRAGLAFVRERGAEQIRAHLQRCVREMLDQLAAREEITLYCDQRATPCLFSFNIKNMSPEDVAYILEHSFQISTRAGLHCAPLIHQALGSSPHGSIRVSPSYATTDAEIEQFLRAIAAIIISTRR